MLDVTKNLLKNFQTTCVTVMICWRMWYTWILTYKEKNLNNYNFYILVHSFFFSPNIAVSFWLTILLNSANFAFFFQVFFRTSKFLSNFLWDILIYLLIRWKFFMYQKSSSDPFGIVFHYNSLWKYYDKEKKNKPNGSLILIRILQVKT